jgi:hypothetical protein
VWLWAALIGVGLIVNAGVLIWTLRPQPAAPTRPASGGEAPVASATGEPRPATGLPPVTGGKPSPAPVSQAPQVSHEPAPPAVPPSAGRAQRTTRAARPSAEAPARPDGAQPRIASPQAAPDQDQPLPRAIQDMVEKMKLQMVVYSDVPSERLVFIDNRKYVEGQLIDGKVVVETIQAETAVLSYQGRRFVLRK